MDDTKAAASARVAWEEKRKMLLEEEKESRQRALVALTKLNELMLPEQPPPEDIFASVQTLQTNVRSSGQGGRRKSSTTGRRDSARSSIAMEAEIPSGASPPPGNVIRYTGNLYQGPKPRTSTQMTQNQEKKMLRTRFSITK
eukprot:PhF_6_TR16580/c0_g1_i1/m.25265